MTAAIEADEEAKKTLGEQSTLDWVWSVDYLGMDCLSVAYPLGVEFLGVDYPGGWVWRAWVWNTSTPGPALLDLGS